MKSLSTLFLTIFACLLGPGSSLSALAYCQLNPGICSDPPNLAVLGLVFLGHCAGLMMTICALVSARIWKAPKGLWLLCLYWIIIALAILLLSSSNVDVDDAQGVDAGDILVWLFYCANAIAVAIFLTLVVEVGLLILSIGHRTSDRPIE